MMLSKPPTPSPIDREAADPRRNNFGFLRVFLASLVVLSHTPILLDGNPNRELLYRLTHTTPSGDLAVDGFFIISGFLITKSWLSAPALGSFLGKRILRIYPGFIAASLISVFVFGPLAQIGHPDMGSLIRLTLKNIVALREVQYPVPLNFAQHRLQLNGSLWTIKWEFACYLLVGVAGVIGLSKLRWPWIPVFALTLIAWVVQSTGRLALPTNIVDTPRLVACFASGVLFYLYRDSVRYDAKLAWASAAAFAACLFWMPATGPGIAVFGGYLVFATAFASIPAVAHIGTKNDISYGLYLYSFPIQQLLIMYFPGISFPALFVTALTLGSAAGFLSWRLVESPCLKAKKTIANFRKLRSA